MTKLALVAILALYVAVLWVESLPMVPEPVGVRVADANRQDRSQVVHDSVGGAGLSDSPLYLRPVLGSLVEPELFTSNGEAHLITVAVGLGKDAVAGSPSLPDSLPEATRRSVEGPSASERSGRATYYDRDLFMGRLMADGVTEYWPEVSGIVSAVDWPLGTKLLVNGVLPVVVSDTGKLERGVGHLDMSERDFIFLAGSLEPGVIAVEIGVQVTPTPAGRAHLSRLGEPAEVQGP